MPRGNFPVQLVARAASVFGWPERSFTDQTMRKELAHAKRALDTCCAGLLERNPRLQKDVAMELTFEQLCAILEEIRTAPFWGDNFTTLSMLTKYIAQKARKEVIATSNAPAAALSRF